ncbi:MAG: hypothetical protein P4L84_06905 [Isosphaeraceae bacterium]|nr:hypothetical protein [Isosphaeraceae bacterium]
MMPQWPAVRHPVRTAAMIAGVVALVGSGAAFVPGAAPRLTIALALGYGATFGWYIVGLVLAPGLPAARWWWISSALPLASMVLIAIGAACCPAAVLRGWRVIGGASVSIIVVWLSAGFFLSALGWLSHVRHRRPVADA